jgi:hypothetical protein
MLPRLGMMKRRMERKRRRRRRRRRGRTPKARRHKRRLKASPLRKPSPPTAEKISRDPPVPWTPNWSRRATKA